MFSRIWGCIPTAISNALEILEWFESYMSKVLSQAFGMMLKIASYFFQLVSPQNMFLHMLFTAFGILPSYQHTGSTTSSRMDPGQLELYGQTQNGPEDGKDNGKLAARECLGRQKPRKSR